MNRKILSLIFIAVTVVFSWQLVFARDSSQITDWYIKVFETEIQVNKDSSLLIVEKITADCGNLPDKHGIFRVLPTKIKTDKGIISNPIELVSITDFNGKPYKYQTIKNKSAGTITWKIGDPDRTVIGENDYKIVYKVKNAIRFYDSSFDELYWNLVGAFWQIDIDSFSAKIVFPAEVTSQNASVEYYAGYLGSRGNDLATYQWLDSNTLYFSSVRPLSKGEDITVSIAFPKDIFTPYQPSFLEKYASHLAYLFFLIPLFVLIFSLKFWWKYGKDPIMKKPIVPEFEIPERITPIQMGMVLSSGRWNDKLITATIIDLAVKKLITIKEIEKKILFLSHKDYELEKNADNCDESNLAESEKILLNALFPGGSNKVNLSSLKTTFYKKVGSIRKAAVKDAVDKNWIAKKSSSVSLVFRVIGFILLVFSALAFSGGLKAFLSILTSGIIFIIFSIIMPKRTRQGTDLLFRIKGMELYMRTAEKYRQQFYEKENIFDKLLPYAIVFNIATLWVKKMEQIYGKEYFQNYHPVWLVAASAGSFNANGFISQLNSITSSISSNTSSSSGHGGGGGAGGGGGGGGGGGW